VRERRSKGRRSFSRLKVTKVTKATDSGAFAVTLSGCGAAKRPARRSLAPMVKRTDDLKEPPTKQTKPYF
jgi:hypothetical protein